MATIKYIIFEHHKRSDGKHLIKFQLTHNRKSKYIASNILVSDKQINKDFTVKDTKVLVKINKLLDVYWSRIENIGTSISAMSVDEVLKIITTEKIAKGIDFVEFCGSYLSGLKSAGKMGTYKSMRPAYNHLKDFAGSIDANDIDSVFLRSFDAYLRKEKKVKRINAADRKHHTVMSSLGDSGVFKVMENIRNFHNKCKEKYNSERNTLISADPFKYYKMPKYSSGRKDMDKDLVSKIVSYRDADITGRKALARDIFMLSFYLCGMNAKDMYDGNYRIVDGRIEYERAKTASRRYDNAFISVKIPDLAATLLEQYTAKYLRRRYSSHEGFTSALSMGAKGFGFTFYMARSAFASIAANICGFGTDMIELALNHFDRSRPANTYVARDWSVIDKVQAGVLDVVARQDPID